MESLYRCWATQAECSSVVVVVVPPGPEIVERLLRPVPPNPPHELQNASDMRNATPPTIIKMTPIAWRLKPLVVTDTANRIMAPTAKITSPVPTPIFSFPSSMPRIESIEAARV